MSHAPRFDLQSHSRHSDGELTPAEVVAAAAAAGVELLALTDHDTVAGVAEARGAARNAGIQLCPAVEISIVDPVGADLHMLGYLVDPEDPDLLEQLRRYRADRERRTAAMVAALNDAGLELDEALLAERARAGRSIGRPHIAHAVTSHPGNARRLAQEGLADASAFLSAYLTEGGPAFRPLELPSVRDAIDTIHRAGGMAVWAHPFWDVLEPAQVLVTLERFAALGLDGAECFYITHTEAQTRLLVGYCAEHDLLRTGSSDFHGPHHRLMSAFSAFSLYGFSPALGRLASST